MRIRKEKKNNKTSVVKCRCTEDEHNKLKQKANLYTEGNLSEWILFAALNYVPSKEDFEKKGK